MSEAAAQADAFFREVVQHGCVWTIRGGEGVPTSTSFGKTAMPFWSQESRARKITSMVTAYHGYEPHSLSLDEFAGRWLPSLEREGLMAGINWAGRRAAGFDLTPREVRWRLAYSRSRLPAPIKRLLWRRR